MRKYVRTLDELRKKAVLFWPRELLEREASVSILPLLLKTQDKFLSVLKLADSGPEAWKRLVDVSDEMKGNLFLKHLMILSDLGRETLSKFMPLEKYFEDGQMNYIWREKSHPYQFKAMLGRKTLSNAVLSIDARDLIEGQRLNDKMEDMIMLLLHGASSVGDTLPDKEKNKCMIGSLIGRSDELETFVRQNYIRVSQQMTGATSNKLGHIAQDYVMEILERELPDWQFKKNGMIPGISQNKGKTETSFDVVARSPQKRFFAIEVSFQFTGNSVIERKAGQAKARQDLLHKTGHQICYVIDGAGNINVRKSAVGTICDFSDCTVAFSEAEINHLAQFLREQSGVRSKDL